MMGGMRPVLSDSYFSFKTGSLAETGREFTIEAYPCKLETAHEYGWKGVRNLKMTERKSSPQKNY